MTWPICVTACCFFICVATSLISREWIRYLQEKLDASRDQAEKHRAFERERMGFSMTRMEMMNRSRTAAGQPAHPAHQGRRIREDQPDNGE